MATRNPLIPFACLASVALAPAPPARAQDRAAQAEAAYFEGLDRYRARAFVDAMDRFERALTLGPPPALRVRALQAFARSALELSATDRRTACARLAPRIGDLAALSPADEAAREALDDLRVLRARCTPEDADPADVADARPLPRPTPPSAPDYRAAWGLTAGAVVAIGGGGAMLALTAGAVEDRDAAAARFSAAADEAGRVDAARDVGYHQGLAEHRGLSATVMFAVGGLLAAGAVWAWLDPPERVEAPFALGVGPGSLTFGGAF